MVPASPAGARPGERVRPGDEADRGGEEAEVHNPREVRAGGVFDPARQARRRPGAADRDEDAGEKGGLEARDAPQRDLLGDHAPGVADRGEQAERNAEAARTAAVRRPGRDHDHAREGDRAAGKERPRIALAEQVAGQQRDQDRADVDEHCRGAGVDPLLGRIQQDAVDAEPEQAAERDQRQVAGGWKRFLPGEDEQAEEDCCDRETSEREPARGEVVAGRADPDERRSQRTTVMPAAAIATVSARGAGTAVASALTPSPTDERGNS